MVSAPWRLTLPRKYSAAKASETVERLTGTDWTFVAPHLGQEGVGTAEVMLGSTVT
jgi:hypothetical protein